MKATPLFLIAFAFACLGFSSPLHSIRAGGPFTKEKATAHLAHLKHRHPETDLSGVTLVVHWHTRSGTCQQFLADLQKHVKKHRLHGLKLVMITGHDTEEEAVKGLSKYGFSARHIIVEHNRLTEYGVKMFPTFYLLDKGGMVVSAGEGYNSIQQKELLSELSYNL